MNPRKFDLVITDVDNTLYDWLSFYIPCFNAMIKEISRTSSLKESDIIGAFKRLNQRRKTTEYSFAIEELDILSQVDNSLSLTERLEKYDSAIHVFRSCRKRLLQPYPDVRDTLAKLLASGIILVAHSDTMIVPVSRRLRQLELDSYFAAICGSRDSGIPAGIPIEIARIAPEDQVGARTELIEFAPGLRKPNPATLTPVLAKFPFPKARVLYVGDSRSRDIPLARASGITDAWAHYGQPRDPSLYNQLLAITYWTQEEIVSEEDQVLQESPSYEIESFSELLGICAVD